ncbi:carbamoyl-phosphate synthase [Sulfobacillus harzensis]|uniref:Carbamoyl-phosphate synthase n=1 Tax=Sulfobacillus harzensis TaxID=2729629 RepID=A0A7Y0L4Z0_9FIRM|nr:carbamoyl-phosphate synthase [Sulfobacillus harzensis]NMP21954.1 carbamoyl-phosphate synthase [Sulfobacillus harzensis]
MIQRPRNPSRYEHPAVVLDLSANGLGVVRSLAHHGIPIYAFDAPPKDQLGKTRLARSGTCPHPVQEESRLLQFLEDLGKTFEKQAVLYLGSDDYLYFASKNRSRLAQYYRFLLPDHELIEAVLDKRLTHELARSHGMVCPQTFVIETEAQLDDIIPQLAFPCILKPAFSSDYRKRLNRKAIVMRNANQLRRDYPYYRKYGQLLVQELIPGDETCLVGVGTLFDDSMELVGVFSGRKLHQYPPYFGTGSIAISRRDEEAIEMTMGLFQALNLKGLAKVEYKRDPRDGALKFIEINARTWFWHGLATRCGVDLSLLYYQLLTGQVPEPATTQVDGVKWVYFVRDFIASTEQWRDGNLPVSAWLKNMAGPKEYALFVWRDPMPALRYAIWHFRHGWSPRVGSQDNPLALESIQPPMR